MSKPAPVAGWYPDPNDPQELRWWNGTHWTTHAVDEESSHAHQHYDYTPPPARRNHGWLQVFLVWGVFLLLVAVGGLLLL